MVLASSLVTWVSPSREAGLARETTASPGSRTMSVRPKPWGPKIARNSAPAEGQWTRPQRYYTSLVLVIFFQAFSEKLVDHFS